MPSNSPQRADLLRGTACVKEGHCSLTSRGAIGAGACKAQSSVNGAPHNLCMSNVLSVGTRANTRKAHSGVNLKISDFGSPSPAETTRKGATGALLSTSVHARKLLRGACQEDMPTSVSRQVISSCDIIREKGCATHTTPITLPFSARYSSGTACVSHSGTPSLFNLWLQNSRATCDNNLLHCGRDRDVLPDEPGRNGNTTANSSGMATERSIACVSGAGCDCCLDPRNTPTK